MASEVFQALNGLDRDGNPFIDPTTGTPSRYIWNGNPVAGTGWLDYHQFYYGGDRYFLMNSGSFSMAPGDTQEVVLAIYLSQGPDNLSSAGALKGDRAWIQAAWDSEFTVFGPPAGVTPVTVPLSSESTGPFTWSFSMVSHPGWNLAPGDKWFHYRLAGVRDSVALTETAAGDTTQCTTTLDFPGITGTTSLEYWILLESTDGTLQTWPSGSPQFNWATFIFGPDTVAPEIVHITQFEDVHYLLYFEKTVSARIRDDRSGVTPVVKWTLGGGAAHSGPMTLTDSVDRVYSGTIHGTPGAFGDTITYWIEATDGSSNQNRGISESSAFVANRTEETIGPWDHFVDQPWKLWNNGQIVYQPDPAWLRVLKLNPLAVGTTDTLQYLRALDLSQFDIAGLAFNTIHSLGNNENFGYCEISTDGQNWEVVKTFTGIAAPHEARISLMDYVGEDAVRIRFRAVRNTGSACAWTLDDMVLHMDSSRLELQPPTVLPGTVFLYPGFPNPFNPATTIRYELPFQTQVTLTVYDLSGRKVRMLETGQVLPGLRSVVWDGRNDHGYPVASGVYFVRLQAGDFVQGRKLVLLR